MFQPDGAAPYYRKPHGGRSVDRFVVRKRLYIAVSVSRQQVRLINTLLEW
jgi:hypothetical protein